MKERVISKTVRNISQILIVKLNQLSNKDLRKVWNPWLEEFTLHKSEKKKEYGFTCSPEPELSACAEKT